MGNFVRDEPALFAGLVRAALTLAISFGVAVTTEQSQAIMGFTGAAIAVVGLALTFYTRSKVTPVANPNLEG